MGHGLDLRTLRQQCGGGVILSDTAARPVEDGSTTGPGPHGTLQAAPTDLVLHGLHSPVKVSVRGPSDTLGLPNSTTYRMVKGLRRNLYVKASKLKLEGIVEVDEAYVKAGPQREEEPAPRGGAEGLKETRRRRLQGEKPPILGVVERARAHRGILSGAEGFHRKIRRNSEDYFERAEL